MRRRRRKSRLSRTPRRSAAIRRRETHSMTSYSETPLLEMEEMQTSTIPLTPQVIKIALLKTETMDSETNFASLLKNGRRIVTY